ncbi:D-isomer specific 2-hydroxyacid dehydrogenase family protein [Pseudomonas entomophila]|uniref:D-isomer specific 2-hydroxyacid dehydrogenase family protein n=1 Tax=Pseudomonas entomophila TaxID=312306 RepID=UPI0023D80273|nr:D-isomer specific 2-hydroxyacid dehydrogenase family protein [Pseudomonas entomophila]MDF0732131.1 D-isomer specific 2-hydroxyacid dehydrogenase family protein [Pseudomonas entomophila]
MSHSIIASQLDAKANQFLRERLPDHQVLDIPYGQLTLEAPADVFIVRPINVRGQRVDTPPPGWPGSLRWVQLVSSGIDFYPDWVFQGPPVTSGKGANAEHVAEFALALVFAAAKQLPGLWVKDAEWRLTPLAPVQGRTLGILGFGNIGQALARKAIALGMRVIALNRPGQPIAEVPGVTRVEDLHPLFAGSDHLVLAAPLTPATRQLIDRQVLASARPGLHLINIARGGLLDQDALLEALDRGLVGRASLDVTEPEPLPADHPLYRHPRVFLSPHTSAISEDGYPLLLERILDNFTRYREGQPLRHLVDPQRGY